MNSYEHVTKKLAQVLHRNRLDGTVACGELMDAFNIKRCPENYLKIVGILKKYRQFLRKHYATYGESQK